MGAAYLLPRLVGLGRATELLVLGEEVDAERAAEIGLATRVVDDEELPAAAAELARRLADGPALAHSTTKVLLTRELDMALGERDRDGGARPGAPDEERRLRRVLRSLDRGPEPGVDAAADRQSSRAARARRLRARRRRSAAQSTSAARPATAPRSSSSSTRPRRSSSPRCARPAASRTSSSRSSSTRRTSRSTARRRRELGEVWRRHFGRRYPAMALIGVSALFEPEARVELMGVAVLDA